MAAIESPGASAEALKTQIKDFWEQEVCGSRNASEYVGDRRRFFEQIDRVRYEQDYLIPNFARFEQAAGKRVLEVGLGTGADFVRWARAGAEAYGRDLTSASVALVKERLSLENLTADVATGDAENLSDFPDEFFDIYYSWGVLMATPNTEKAIAEAYRVLKPGGTLKLMFYHYPSIGGALVWLVHGPLHRDWRWPREVIADHVESPGMKYYTVREARRMVRRHFRDGPIETHTFLGPGDLLTHRFSEKYRGAHWEIMRQVYPRWLVRHLAGHRLGTVLTIHATK